MGLLGARHLNTSRLTAPFGYALDTTGIDRVIIGAPAANRLHLCIHGIGAHAGLNPEDGISAFAIAAKAMAGLRLGRLDDQSTANLGLMHGGVATNIVPPLLSIEGEVRSHCPQRLASHTTAIFTAFQDAAASWPMPSGSGASRPSVKCEARFDYPAMLLHEHDPVVMRIRKAGIQSGRKLDFLVAGGGSDANFLNSYGLPTAIIATGMNNVHTVEEYLDLQDIISLTELLHAVVVIDG